MPRAALRPTLLAAALALLSGCGLPPSLVRWGEHHDPDVLFSVATREKVVALTIDDAPSDTYTPRLLDVLEANDAKATFFLIGSRIPGHEALVRRIVAEGHELGNHMMSNVPSVLLGPKAFDARMEEAGARIRVFAPVEWLRPASALFGAQMICSAKAHGYAVVLGSVYPGDALLPLAGYQAAFILDHVRPGAILIVHDGLGAMTRSPEVLARVLPVLRRRGYRVVTLSELVRLGRPRGPAALDRDRCPPLPEHRPPATDFIGAYVPADAGGHSGRSG